jgi:hypothetical protein
MEENPKKLGKTLQAIRRSQARMALEEMQQQSLERGLDRLTNTDIGVEIEAARQGRKR